MRRLPGNFVPSLNFAGKKYPYLADIPWKAITRKGLSGKGLREKIAGAR
jgi:hypothetical protein